MTVLQKIKSLFKRPKAKAKAEPLKVAETTEKKVAEGGQQSTGPT